MADNKPQQSKQPREPRSTSIPESQIQEGIDKAQPGTEKHDTPLDDVVSANTPQEGAPPSER